MKTKKCQIEPYRIEEKMNLKASPKKISWNQFVNVIVANKNFGNCISNSFHEIFTNESNRASHSVEKLKIYSHQKKKERKNSSN